CVRPSTRSIPSWLVRALPGLLLSGPLRLARMRQDGKPITGFSPRHAVQRWNRRMVQEERKIRLLRCRRAERFCNLRAKCGQAIWRGTAKLLSYLVDLVGIEPTTSSMPWKRAPKLRHRPTCCKDATFLLSPLRRYSSNLPV